MAGVFFGNWTFGNWTFGNRYFVNWTFGNRYFVNWTFGNRNFGNWTFGNGYFGNQCKLAMKNTSCKNVLGGNCFSYQGFDPCF